MWGDDQEEDEEEGWSDEDCEYSDVECELIEIPKEPTEAGPGYGWNRWFKIDLE